MDFQAERFKLLAVRSVPSKRASINDPLGDNQNPPDNIFHGCGLSFLLYNGVESGRCEPNEFRCNNGRCVQKMWVCDMEDDCGDRSDEQYCGVKQPGESCSPQEFKCQAREQCIPRSYHCDGQNDCQDGSDEVGCVPPTVVEPPVRQLEVCIGETAVLNCRATGVPVPHISWRLNWGPVCDPPRCTQTSINGFGTLTISGVTERDQGAYSCEAINVKGRVLATPDAIMTVKDCRPVPQTRCHEAGTSTKDRERCICKTYASGPDCGQCGEYSFYLAPSNPQGCIRCFCMGITRNCHSSNYFRTQERVVFSYDDQGVAVSDIRERNVDQTQADLSSVRGYLSIEPGDRQSQTLYWKMPSRLGGNKLTSYGGKLKFFFQFFGHGRRVDDPLVVLKGNEITLIHQGPRNFQADRPNEILIDMYETSWNREDGQEVTREHFLMTLAGLDSFLIRATHVQGQTKSSRDNDIQSLNISV
uniref:Basement membrane-specific heparan sulfate proteoglycan core protein n=1 Tax=Romanomermis culicivorax TaxID=13658 RepID=A0A915KQ45_ROMCU